MVFRFYYWTEVHVLRQKRYAPMQRFPVAIELIRYVHLSLFAEPTEPIWLIHGPAQQRVHRLCGVTLIQTSDGHKDSHHVQPGTPRAVDL